MILSKTYVKKLCLILGFLLFSSCTKDQQPVEEVISSDSSTAPAELPSDTVSQRQRDQVDGFKASRIHFDFDKSEIKPKFHNNLEMISTHLKNNSSVQLEIEGHCDERGTSEYNLALGQRRAESVKRYLVNLGVNPDNISTITYGEEKLLDQGHSRRAHYLNRRAEFNLR